MQPYPLAGNLDRVAVDHTGRPGEVGHPVDHVPNLFVIIPLTYVAAGSQNPAHVEIRSGVWVPFRQRQGLAIRG